MITDLRIDHLYRNTNNWNNPEDEFNIFFRFSDGKGINNVSGFRPKSAVGSSDTSIENCSFCVLITNAGEIEWPDELDHETGIFTYYGDNRIPGNSIDATQMGGNRLLQNLFQKLHTNLREKIQPILCFQSVKLNGKSYMRFLGLAAPGAQGYSAADDLVAVWKIRDSLRFQNYKSTFTILKEETISKAWLEDIVCGVASEESEHCPSSWKYWISTGIYRALECENELKIRSKKSQLPQNKDEEALLGNILVNFTEREFEYASAEIVGLLDRSFRDLYVTRGVRDGGRDVIGKYYLGHAGHQIRLQAIVEAKKWKLTSSVGVKPVMRLISRLKHNDIGVFITTSYFDQQIQRELIEDGHHIMLISGGDIAKILMKSDLQNPESLAAWINAIKRKASQTD